MQDTTVGRHRLGGPGRVPVSALVRVVRRNLFVAWFKPGKHRRAEPVRGTVRRPATAHAV